MIYRSGIRQYEAGELSNIVGRAAKRVLAQHEKWLETLLDDAGRVWILLLKGEVPNFLIRMSDWEPLIAEAVVSGPVSTISLIHKHLWRFVPEMPAGSIRVFHSGLPGYLRHLYPAEHLEKIMIMP